MSSLLTLLDAAAGPPPGLNLKYGSVALGVLLMSIALIRWSIRTYLETSGITPVKGLRAPKMSAQFRMLQEMGMATGEQLSTMAASDREQLFAAAMTQRLVAAKGGNGAGGVHGANGSGNGSGNGATNGFGSGSTNGSAHGPAHGLAGFPGPLAPVGGPPGVQPSTPQPAAGFRVSCSPDYLFCPACGATLGDRRTPLGYITSCLTCKRVLKARLQGERVTIESA